MQPHPLLEGASIHRVHANPGGMSCYHCTAVECWLFNGMVGITQGRPTAVRLSAVPSAKTLLLLLPIEQCRASTMRRVVPVAGTIFSEAPFRKDLRDPR